MSNGKYNAARRRQQPNYPNGNSPSRKSQPSQVGTPDLGEITDSDDFRMYCMKVLPCSKRVAHDWTTCVFAHNGEKARRRDPRKYNYTGIACVDMKDGGSCERGDDCPYAHSTFEYWLHPTRYRTQLCKDLGDCKRDTCFFAHHPDELRVPDQKPYISPEQLALASLSGIRRSMEKEKELNKGTANPQPMAGGVPTRRQQPEDLAYTPYSHGQSEIQSPRLSAHEPVPVRSSAPMPSSVPLMPAPMVSSCPSGSWLQQPVRRSANVTYHQGLPFDSQRQRGDEIALAETLAKLSMTLTQQPQGDQRRDDVIQTVHQVLQQALDQKESSLGYDLSRSLGNMTGEGLNDEDSLDLSGPGEGTSARSSSDIGSPHLPRQFNSIEPIASGEDSPLSIHGHTNTINPWNLNPHDGLGYRI